MNLQDSELEDIEINLLLEGIYRHYGFDFREYAPASIKRRVLAQVRAEDMRSVSGFQEKALHDPACMARLLLALSINSVSMFRDPAFYFALRKTVIPILRTYPFVRIWHAGCSTGEEVYSTAIVLREEGLYDRARIYATDMNEAIVAQAKAGRFPLGTMRLNSINYEASGGKRALGDFYDELHDTAVMHPSLRENVVFGQHNLASDRSFNEFNLILCRNVMIYFNRSLQGRVHDLLHNSLAKFGILGIGARESMRFNAYQDCYEQVDGNEKIFRRLR